MQETDILDEYILRHIDEEGAYLKALYRDTHVKLLEATHGLRTSSGPSAENVRPHDSPPQYPRNQGTYSGYSALCLAEGLEEGGRLYTFEINDEQEDFTRPWIENSPYASRIEFIIGDALEKVPQMGVRFDLAFIDGDKPALSRLTTK